MANTTKTPYAVVVFHKDRNVQPISFPFVKSIYYTHNYLLRNMNFDYWYMNVYNRKTRQYIKRQYFNDYVVDKPPY